MDHRYADQHAAALQGAVVGGGRAATAAAAAPLQGRNEGDNDDEGAIAQHPRSTGPSTFNGAQYFQPSQQFHPQQYPPFPPVSSSSSSFSHAPSQQQHLAPAPAPSMMPEHWHSPSFSPTAAADHSYAYQAAQPFTPAMLQTSMQQSHHHAHAFPSASPISATTDMQAPPSPWSMPNVDTAAATLTPPSLTSPGSASTFVSPSSSYVQSSTGGWTPLHASEQPRWSHDAAVSQTTTSSAPITSSGGVGFVGENIPADWAMFSSADANIQPTPAQINPFGSQYQGSDFAPWPTQAQLHQQQQQSLVQNPDAYRTEQLNPSVTPSQPQHGAVQPLYSEQAAAPLEMSLPIRGNTPERIRYDIPLATSEWDQKMKTKVESGTKKAKKKNSNREKSDKSVAVSKRSGPLSQEQRDKADEMRYWGACWRCRRYRKPCDAGPGGICTSCRTSGFRVWPSSIGCRRGDAADIVRQVVPPVAEDVLADLMELHIRTPNWRTHYGFVILPQDTMPGENLNLAVTRPIKGKGKKILDPGNGISEATLGIRGWWDEVSRRVRTTGVFGPEMDELMNIARDYQISRNGEVPILSATSAAMSACVDFYHAFIATTSYFGPGAAATPTPSPNPDIPPSEYLKATISTLRSSLNQAWKTCLTAAIQGRRSSWLPAFLSICLYVPSMTIMLDATLAVPPAARAAVWRDVRDLFKDIRQKHYAMAIDLLRILARGSWPLGLDCWRTIEMPVSQADAAKIPASLRMDSTQSGKGEPMTVVREPEGMKLVDGDTASFDGFMRLKQWGTKNQDVFETYGKMLYGRAPFEDTVATAPPIAALFRVFEEGNKKS